MENGKGVVTDADFPLAQCPPRLHRYRCTVMHLYMQFWRTPQSGHAARAGAEQSHRVLARVLCHNMCGLIRVTRELRVEMTLMENGSQPKLFVRRDFWRIAGFRP